MIGLRVALPGEGKSLTASREIREAVQKGRTVYTNIHCNEESPFYHYFQTKDWEIILRLQDGTIYFDEGQDILDARNWVNLPIGFRHLLTKGRHEGLDLIIITQHVKQLDVASRRLFDPRDIKKVIKLISVPKWNWGLFFVFDGEMSGDDEVKIVEGLPDIVWATKKDFEYYNSHALRSQKPPHSIQNCALCGRIHELSTELSTVEKIDKGVYANAESAAHQEQAILEASAVGRAVSTVSRHEIFKEKKTLIRSLRSLINSPFASLTNARKERERGQSPRTQTARSAVTSPLNTTARRAPRPSFVVVVPPNTSAYAPVQGGEPTPKEETRKQLAIAWGSANIEK